MDVNKCKCELFQGAIVIGANFCHYCGCKITKKEICNSCQTELIDDALFCFRCGVKKNDAKQDDLIQRVERELLIQHISKSDFEAINVQLLDRFSKAVQLETADCWQAGLFFYNKFHLRVGSSIHKDATVLHKLKLLPLY